MSFEKMPLNEFVTLQRGFDLPVQNRKPGQYPVVAANGIVGSHSEFKVNSPGVVLGRSGTIGNARLVETPFWALNTTLFVKDFKGNSPFFVYYVLRMIDFTSFNAGGTVPTLNRNHIGDLLVPRVPLNHQIAISDVLLNIDKRIEANSRTAKTLESIAKALFRSWFVDFDPVRAKMRGEKPAGMDDATAALFPDTMEESELGDIPVGWEWNPLDEIAEISGGKQLSRDEFRDDGLNPVFGGAGEMGRTNLQNADGFVITVGRVGAYCGQFFSYRGSAWVNNNASRLKPREGYSPEWLFLSLRELDIDSIKKGAAQPYVSNGDLGASNLIIAPQPILDTFEDVIGPIFQMRETLERQVRNLVHIRDSLLPRLISGELLIPEDLVA